ncbi:MAG: VirB3 family type IV secretion system protein [Sedimentibacter sp.]
MEEKAIKEFASLNGLGRPAMIGGIPLKVGLFIIVVSVVISFIAQIFIGIMGFLTIVFAIPILLGIKAMTATDDHALRILWFEVKFFFKKLFAGKQIYGGKFYIVSSNNLKQDVAYYRKFTDVSLTKRKVKEIKD